MSFNWRGYASGMWARIKDSVVQDATRDQSEKVSLLARDLYLYIQDLEKKLDARTSELEAVFNTSGVTIIVTGTACPTGWVEDTTWRNRFLQGPDASGANIGTTGAESITIASDGSHAHVMPNHQHNIPSDSGHTHNVPLHQHTISADGSHSHTIGYLTLDLQTGGSRFYPGDPYNPTSTAGSHSHSGYTGNTGDFATGSGGSHSHGGYTGFNTSENTNGAGSHNHSASGITPAFRRALFCKKAA